LSDSPLALVKHAKERRRREQDRASRGDSPKDRLLEGGSPKIHRTLEKVLTKALKGGEEVQITGFGKFYVREQKAREGFNPQTRERMRIPAQKVPAFSAGQGLKQAI
jgi:nucleoid DNA-binding protein